MTFAEPLWIGPETLRESPTDTRIIWTYLAKSGQTWTFLNTSSGNSQPTAPDSRILTEISPPRPEHRSVGTRINRMDHRCEQALVDCPARSAAATLST